MRYQETIDYLYRMLPMFSRIGEQAIKKDLYNTLELCNFLNHPQNKYPTIHIAGTNGKGSVSHMLASILQEAGYKTGLYTSPHLKDFRERIKINGVPCEESYVVDFTDTIKDKIEELSPSFFEITVAMAFEYFAQKSVDIAIIETGLGGRLDSTNIIQPILSVITNISMDHQQLLGNTLEEIAFEKAGIIKQNTPVVIGRKHINTDVVFTDKADACRAPLLFASDNVVSQGALLDNNYLSIDVLIDGQPQSFRCDLTAQYQAENICTVLAAIDALERNTVFSVEHNAIQSGLSNVVKNTQLLGRWQTLQQHPKVIADVGHNVDGIKKVLDQLKSEDFNQLHFIFGAVKDKDIDNILALLPKDAIYYFTEPSIPRKLDVQILLDKAKQYLLNGSKFLNPKDALSQALSDAHKDDLILIAGSFFVVAEVI